MPKELIERTRLDKIRGFPDNERNTTNMFWPSSKKAIYNSGSPVQTDNQGGGMVMNSAQ